MAFSKSVFVLNCFGDIFVGGSSLFVCLVDFFSLSTHEVKTQVHWVDITLLQFFVLAERVRGVGGS